VTSKQPHKTHQTTSKPKNQDRKPLLSPKVNPENNTDLISGNSPNYHRNPRVHGKEIKDYVNLSRQEIHQVSN